MSEAVVTAVRVGWLTLTGMMLVSRIAFQWAGPVRMRAFLDRWKRSTTKRWWGLSALVCGIGVLMAGGFVWSELGTADVVLFVSLVGVLVGDGLLNALPGSFGEFKVRMQDAWVRRQRDPSKRDDRALFGTVNLLLGCTSLLVAALVVLYRPIAVETVGFSLLLAVLLTGILITAALREQASPAERH